MTLLNLLFDLGALALLAPGRLGIKKIPRRMTWNWLGCYWGWLPWEP